MPTAIASAMTIRIAATANVARIPAPMAEGRAVVMSIEVDANANTAPMEDEPVIRPRLRDRLSMAETTPRWAGRILVMTAVLLATWNSAYPAVMRAIGAM